MDRHQAGHPYWANVLAAFRCRQWPRRNPFHARCKACYRCLLDYANQPDHSKLDRYQLKEILWIWPQRIEGFGRRGDAESDLSRCARCDSQLERKWLQGAGFGAQDASHSQANNAEYLRSTDFVSRRIGKRHHFQDGPVHDQQMTQVNDVAVTEQLKNEGTGSFDSGTLIGTPFLLNIRMCCGTMNA